MTGQVCWRSECRNGCYYGPDACSLADHAAVPCPAPPTERCEECRDAIPDGEGCRHDGHVWCGSCFVERCRECRADLADDYAAELSTDRDR